MGIKFIKKIKSALIIPPKVTARKVSNDGECRFDFQER